MWYRFTIYHVPGKFITTVDAFSRVLVDVAEDKLTEEVNAHVRYIPCDISISKERQLKLERINFKMSYKRSYAPCKGII